MQPGDSPRNGELIYGLEDRPRALVAILAALQHLLAIIVPIVTPGLLICQALGVSARDSNLILSMSLVISGIATYLQCRRFGPLGAGLLVVQGTSFNFVGPLIAGGASRAACWSTASPRCWPACSIPFPARSSPRTTG